MVDLNTALYYTLSTISQTLAGALGLFAAFMIIRIDAFNKLIYERMTELYSELGFGDEGLTKARASGNAKAVFAFYRGRQEKARPTGGSGHPPQMPLGRSQEDRLAEGEAMVGRKQALLDRVGRALLANGLAIVSCFAGLGATPLIASRAAVAWVALVVAVLFGAGCIVALLCIMKRALSEV
jgi:hypothetical protein